MNAACEIASTYLNNTQSVCDQKQQQQNVKKRVKNNSKNLSHGPHRWWHFLLSDFIALFSSSGAFRRVVGIYVNKCFNFILQKTHKIQCANNTQCLGCRFVSIIYCKLIAIIHGGCRRLQICNHLLFMTLDIISFVNFIEMCYCINAVKVH